MWGVATRCWWWLGAVRHMLSCVVREKWLVRESWGKRHPTRVGPWPLEVSIQARKGRIELNTSPQGGPHAARTPMCSVFVRVAPPSNTVEWCPLGGVWGGGAPPPASDTHGLGCAVCPVFMRVASPSKSKVAGSPEAIVLSLENAGSRVHPCVVVNLV